MKRDLEARARTEGRTESDNTPPSITQTDASIMVLAHEYGTRDLLTTDQRHFRAVRPILAPEDGSYRLLPCDA